MLFCFELFRKRNSEQFPEGDDRVEISVGGDDRRGEKPGSVPSLSQLRHGAKIYCGEFSAAAWAPGADAWRRDCIDLFEEYGWDWTYHAFREWNGWSVEHEGPDAEHLVPSADNPRKRALLDGLARR